MNKNIPADQYDVMKIHHREHPNFDREKIMKAIVLLEEALGDNPEREGLKGTPDRVARAFEEMFEGMAFTNDEIADMFSTTFTEKGEGLVAITNIPVFSTCEHHFLLMYDMKVSVGYIPNGKVIGLSKAARVAEMVAHRLQLQERIGEDIAYIMKRILNTPDVIVVVEGRHGCMEARGAKSANSTTRTASIHGRFDTNPVLRQEFYSLIEK